ncbi:MAG: nucleotidyltransferase family protein [Clostridiales bacterium]|nr:nucleotidyltransferase family protein [Clostridiales bacterium]
MNKEEKFLISLCKAYLFGEQVDIPNDLNWKLFFKLAKEHNLIAICHCALNAAKDDSKIPTEYKKAFQDKFYDSVYVYECQKECINDLKSVLTSCETPYILFKGSVLKELYPVPESRLMGDIDVLIKSDDSKKVKKALIKSGYTCTAQNGPVHNFTKKGVLVEVHTRIVSDLGDNAFTNPFDNADFDNFCGTLDDNYNFAYLIAHTAHHFKFYGAGIKLVLDLAVMLKEKDIDLEKVFDILAEINLTKFADVILSVCFEWFGVGKNSVEDTKKVQRYLMDCGAFGTMRNATSAAITRKDMEQGKRISPFMLRLRLAFPSYEKLRGIPYIRFIDGRPWLLPYAWCYRFYYNFKNRRKHVIHAVQTLSDENTAVQAKEELELFKEIGLV